MGVKSHDCHLHAFKWRTLLLTALVLQVSMLPVTACANVPPDDCTSNPIRKLDRYVKSHELAYERMARIRRNCLSTIQPGSGSSSISQKMTAASDSVLSCPEQFRSRVLRSLVWAAKWLEECAELVSDMSGMIERLFRHGASAGKKHDIALVIASGLARVITGQFSAAGFAPHKAAGACLYGVSTVLSGLALAIAHSPIAKRYHGQDLERRLARSRFDACLYKLGSRPLLRAKQKTISQGMRCLDGQHSGLALTVKKWCLHLSPGHRLVDPGNRLERKTHCSYIWQQLHQYGPLTQGLMNAAYLAFQGVNKLMGSFDKYLGCAIARICLAPRLGHLLGHRFGLALAVSLAAALSVPMAPLQLGISSIGACACGLALLCLLAAKLTVELTPAWRGDIAPP